MNRIINSTPISASTPKGGVGSGNYDDVSVWHGMDSVEHEITMAVTGEKVNGWAITTLFQGTETVTNRLIGRMETYSIVSGLLVGMGVALMIDPTDRTLSELSERTDSALDLTYFVGYTFLGTATIILYFSVIVLATLFTSILRATARDADVWRVIIRNGSIPGIVDGCFAAGNVGVTLLMALSLVPDFGPISSAVFAGVIITIVGFAMLLFNTFKLQSAGHPVHGWKKYHPEEFDVSAPLRKIHALAELDRSNRLGSS